MNSICLSVAPNLRCQGLTRIENIVLLVPPAIELVFTFTLAFTNASVRGRKRWILVLDGLSFFSLALLDFLAHVFPEISNNVDIFNIVDFVAAGASFLPIFAYTVFLFLFARSNFVKLLPTRFNRVVTYSLLALIPPIIAFNELGSLIGISHKVIPPAQVGVGFSNAFLQRIALFFSSGALALLTLFQAALFSLSFIRLIRAFLDERRIEDSNKDLESREEIHLFRGLGWLAAGLKLGAIESVVGFADVSFAIAIIRRVLRLFGRGAIMIGVIKGLNVIEDFVKFESDVKARRSEPRRSKRLSRFMISNPRNSTFRQMSPHAASFHAAQSENRVLRRHGPSPLALGANSLHSGFMDASRKERVTVQYDGRTPPVLQMRFSALDIDVHPLPANSKTTLSTVVEDPLEDQRSIYTAQTPIPSSRDIPPAHTRARTIESGTSVRHSMVTQTSRFSNSFDAVREIATRFPNLPPRVVSGYTPPLQRNVETGPDAEWRLLSRNRSLERRQQLEIADSNDQAVSALVSPANSIKRKPVPAPSIHDEHIEAASPTPLGQRYPQDDYSPAADDAMSFYSSDNESMNMHAPRWQTDMGTPDLTGVSTLDGSPMTPSTFNMYSVASTDRPPGRLATRVMAIEHKAAHAQESYDDEEERRQQRLAQLRQQLRISGAYDGAPAAVKAPEQELEVSWLNNDPLTALQAMSGSGYPVVPAEMDDEEVSEAILDEAWRRAGLTRIKSLSQVRVHTTPRVEQTSDVRGSLFAVEEEDMAMPLSPESTQKRISASLKKPARLDSGVLGEDDKKLVRQGIYI